MVVGILKVAGRIESTRLQEGILFEHPLAQMDHRVVNQATAVAHLPNAILAVQCIAQHFIPHLIRMEHLCQRHMVMRCVLLRMIGHKLLMEPEIAAILKIRRDLGALRGHRLGIKLHPLVQQRLPVFQQLRNHGVADVRRIGIHRIWLPRS